MHMVCRMWAAMFAPLREALYNYFVYYYCDLRGRVSMQLLRARAINLFAAAIDEGVITDLPLGWRGSWLTVWLCRWKERLSLASRAKNRAVHLSFDECVRRLGALWRNCIRVAAFFAPDKLEWDGFDHTPTQRRLQTGKMMAPKGEKAIAPREDHAGDHERHTTVLWSSSDGKKFKPVVCFKALAPDRLSDINLRKVPKNVALQFSPSGSFDEKTSLDMIDEKLPLEA